MSYELTPRERTNAIDENVQTILDVPRDVLPKKFQADFLERAYAGNEVYAYEILPPGDSTRVAFNIWDTDSRIPFSNALMTWTITDTQSLGDHNYLVCLHNEIEGTNLEIMHHVIQGKPDSDYAHRRILAYIQHCNVFGVWPQSGLAS